MSLYADISVLVTLLGQTSAEQRWQALRRNVHSASPDWLGAAALVLGVAAGLLLVGYWIVQYRRRAVRPQPDWGAFYERARRHGLSPRESGLLEKMALAAELHEVDTIFTLDTAFRKAAGAYLGGEGFARLDEDKQLNIVQSVGLLRTKLGFGASAVGEGQTSSRQIVEGTRLNVFFPDTDTSCSGTVRQCTSDHLVIELDESPTSNDRELWTVRFFDSQAQWEFQTPLKAYNDGLAVLAHCEQMRVVNLRRFNRVSVERPALVAHFPFQGESRNIVAPSFQPARVTEVAGPGLRLQWDGNAERGDRLLVVMQFQPTQIIHAAGKVRRIYESDDIPRTLGVELIGLTPTEISQLTRLTNAVAIQKRNGNRDQHLPELEPLPDRRKAPEAALSA
jgi:hypothetical protein